MLGPRSAGSSGRGWSAAALGAALFCCAGRTPAAAGTVTGTITYSGGFVAGSTITVFASSDLFHNGLLATQAVASGGDSVAYSLDSLPAGDYFIAAFAAASPESLSPSTPIGVYQGYARVTVPEQGTVTGKDFALGIDNTAPSSAFSSPVSGSTLAALGLVQGTASDNAALDGNIWLAAQDLSNGQWWDSQGQVWVSTNGPLVSQANAQVQGDPPSVSWSVDLSTQANGANSFAGNLTPGHQYRLYERVQDLVGNSQAQPAALDFSFAQASSTMATLSGTISNPAGYPEGSTVFLMVSTNGFSTQPQAIPLTASGGQSLAFSLTLPAPGSYMIGALMGDPGQVTSASPMGFYNHIASVTLSVGATVSGLDFSIAADPVQPTASITSMVNGSTLTALSSLQGASQDNVAATVSLQIAAQDLADGKWWNSQTRQWVESGSPVFASLTRQGPLSESAAWSVDLAAEFGDPAASFTPGHFYKFYVLAKDFAGNVSSQPAEAGFWWQPEGQGPMPPGTIWNQVLGTSSVAWSWSFVTGATGYAVYESSSGPLLATVSGTSFTLTGLSPNQGATLCVASMVSAVESARNCSAVVYTWAAVPTGPYFAAVTSVTAVLAWDPAGNASGTLYRAMLSTNAFSSVFASLDSTQTFVVFQGLPPATPLSAAVQAANGDSVWTGASTLASTATSSATWDYAPPSPSGAQGVAQGPSSILWTWSAVSSAQGYKVYLGTAMAGSVADPSFLQVGLSTASPNSICVSAYNAAGESGCSWAFANTGAAVPGAPSLLSASTGSVTVYWDGRGNPGTVSYQVLLSTDDFSASGSTAIPFSAGLHSAMASVSGLEPSTSYYLRVQARNMSDEVTPASQSGLVRTAELAPFAPWAVLASAELEHQRVVLSWQAAGAGTPAVSFNVYRLGLGLLASGVTSTLYVDASPLASATYYYQVAGVNAAGLEGPASESASVAVDFTAPAPVSDLRLAGARFSSGEADLAWTEPADDFTGTEGYALFMSTDAHFDAAASSVVLPAAAPGQAASATVPVSSAAVTYFMLRSRDRAGNISAPSNTVLVDPVPPMLGSVDLAEGAAIVRPRSVSVQAFDNVALSSAAIFVDGVLASSAPAVGGMLAPLFLDSRLFADGSRSIAVTVYDSFGNQASALRSATLAYAPPEAPTIYSPAQDFATTVATINVSGTCEALPGIGVQVQANGVDLESAACVNGSWSLTPATLPAEGDVSLTALAFEARGFSGRSPAVEGSYSSHAPQAPEAPTISAGAHGQALLEWSAPAQGATPSYYRVYRATDDSLLSAGSPAPAQSLRVANRLTQRSFSDTPPADNLYFYGITAVDGAGNESPLSEVVYALTDRQPPAAQLLIASAPPLGMGAFQASLALSEVLQQAPLATFTPPHGQPLALDLAAVTATLWQATVTVTAEMGSGPGVFSFEGTDLAGNTGTALSSATWAIRTAGPAAALSLSKASPVGAGSLALTLSLDEPAAAAPSLAVIPQGQAPIPVALAAAAPWDNTAWSGTVAIGTGTGDGQAALSFSAVDALGNQSSALSAGATYFVIDTAPPGAPLGLSYHNLAAGQLRLSWSWNSLAGERPVQYKVYRDLSLAASVTPGEDSSGSYTDSPGDEQTHAYGITALDLAGNESLAAEVSAAADVTPPPAPANLSAAFVNEQLVLDWQASPGAAAYNLYRATYPITGISGLAPIKSGAVAPYLDLPVEDAVYHYAVTALDASGNLSLPSAGASIVFDKGLPSVAILGVSDNAFYKADVAPAFTVTDLILDTASVRALLDGQSFASGAAVSAEGRHTLTVSGANTAGRTASASASFTIDKTAPALSFSLAQNAQITSTSPLSVAVEVSDLNPGASTFLLVNQTLATSVPFQTGQAISRNGSYQLQASAVDLGGNSSTATLAFTFEIGPLAPAGLSVKVRDTARLSWTSPEPDVIAYRVYRDNGRISASLLADTSFEDTGYTASGHVYEVSAIDAAGVEGPRARATVPAAVLGLQAPVLTRGFFDALHPTVRNDGAGALSIGPAVLTLQADSGAVASATAAAVSVPAGQTGSLEGVLATPLGLGACTLRLSVALPTDAGAQVQLEGDFPMQVRDPEQPVLEAFPGALVLGTRSPVQVRLYNRGSAAMDVVTAEVVNSTFAATDAVQVSLQTPQGMVLGSGGLLQTGNGANSAMLAGRQVFFVSIPPNSSFLFDPVQVVVPNTASGSLNVTAAVSTPTFSLPFSALPGVRGFASSAGQATTSQLSYVATSQPERLYYDQGSSVTVRGQALDALSGVPVPNMSVAVHVMSNGFDRQVSAVTDSSGSYSAAFFPLPNEAGLYTVSAANPAVVNLAAQATFTIVGMGLQYSGFAATLAQNSSYTFTVDLTNIGASELTGLSAMGAVLSGSGLSVSIDPGSVPSVLAAGAKAALSVTVAAGLAASSGTLSMTVSEAHGFERVLPITATVMPARAIGLVTPQQFEIGMVGGDVRTVALVIENKGFQTWENVTVTDPSLALSWARIQGRTGQVSLGHIPPGGNANVTLEFSPPVGSPSQTYALPSLAQITSSNLDPVAVGASVVVTSDRKGGVLVTVINADKERNANGQGVPVAGAKVTLTSLDVAGLAFNASVDANGLAQFSQVPSGNYVWRAEAQGFQTVTGTTLVEPGLAVPIEAVLPTATVSYRWSVTPTTIQDQYSITLAMEFQTEVLAPAIVVTPATLDLTMVGGQTLYTQLVITNRGLISAFDYEIEVAGDSAIQAELPFASIPEIKPGQSVTVPVKVTLAHASCHGTKVTGKYRYSSMCNKRVLAWAPQVNITAGQCAPAGSATSLPSGGGVASWLWPATVVGLSLPAPRSESKCGETPPANPRVNSPPTYSCSCNKVKPTTGGVAVCTNAPLRLPAHSPGLDGDAVTNSLNPKPSGWADPTCSIKFSEDSSMALACPDGVEEVIVPVGPLDQFQSGTGKMMAAPPQDFNDYICVIKDNTCTQRSPDGTVITYEGFGSTITLAYRNAPSQEVHSTFLPVLLTDRNGNTIKYDREQATGRLLKETDIHGRWLAFSYDSQARLSGISDSAGRGVGYSYDSQGDRVSETDVNGDVTSYLYDSAHRIAQIAYPNGGKRTFVFDEQGRALSESDDDGNNHNTYTYYASSTTQTDALGRVTKYEWNDVQGLRKITKIIDPAGGVTVMGYDASQNLTSVTDALGRVTSYQYDEKGNVTSVTDAGNGKTQTRYESNFNQPTIVTDAKGYQTSMYYDAVGNLIQTQDALGNRTLMSYDRQGHVTGIKDPLGNVMSFIYDGNGAMTGITDPLGRTTAISRDALSRLTRNADPMGKQTDFTYDAAGNLTQMKDAKGGITVYGYGPGRTGKLMSTLTDAKGHPTGFGYDVLGRLTSVTNALSQAKHWTYDKKSRLTSVTDAKGQTINFEYDDLDRLTVKHLPEGDVTYHYDEMNNLTRVANYNGSIVEMTYDPLNRLTQSRQTLPGGFSATIEYAYDADGNRTGMSTPWGSFSYEYDSLDRLTRITNPQAKMFAFSYDASGRRRKLTYPNGIETSYAYDAVGQVTQIVHKRISEDTAVAFVNYTYDSAGNRTTMMDISGTHSYGYDDLHRLVSASHPVRSHLPVKSEVFSFDATGNRIADAVMSGYQYDNANRLLGNSIYTFSHDANGNRTGQTENATSAHAIYSYNSENQLIQVNMSTGAVMRARYDALGRRVEKSTGSDANQTVRYIYDQNNIVAILNGNNDLIAMFSHSMDVDEALMMHHVDDIEYSFHSDGLGSVVAFTDKNSRLVEQVEYEAYGKPVFIDGNEPPRTASSPATGSPFAFTGREFDAETGLFFYRARYYDATTGRFLAEDPIGISGGDVNLFTYVANRPLRYTDPSGLLYNDPDWGPPRCGWGPCPPSTTRHYLDRAGFLECIELFPTGVNVTACEMAAYFMEHAPPAYAYPLLYSRIGLAITAASLSYEIGHVFYCLSKHTHPYPKAAPANPGPPPILKSGG